MIRVETPFFEWEIEFVAWLTELRSDVLAAYLNVFNFTGEELFFSIALPFAYWTLSKRIGFQLSLAVFVSFFINGFFKDFFQASRPYQAYPDRIVPQYESHSYSFPSGHALESFTFWGFIAAARRNAWWTAAAAVIVVHVAFAKMTAGVHWPADILFGWMLAAALLIVSFGVIRHFENAPPSTPLLIACALLIPAAMMALYYGAGVGGRLDEENVYQSAGLISSMLLAYGWERARIRFVIPLAWWRRLSAFAVGISVLFVLKEGADLLLPDAVWSDFVQYGLLGLWTVGVAPWVFVVTRLYDRHPDLPRESGTQLQA